MIRPVTHLLYLSRKERAIGKPKSSGQRALSKLLGFTMKMPIIIVANANHTQAV